MSSRPGRTQFMVLDRSRVTENPTKVPGLQVEPYARRRFDGLRADTPEERTEYTHDGQPYKLQTFVLGSAPAKLPVPQPRCLELPLIEQLETLPAPTATGASRTCWSMPAMRLHLGRSTAVGHHRHAAGHQFQRGHGRVQGRVTVLYERGDDLYAVITATVNWSSAWTRCSSMTSVIR